MAASSSAPKSYIPPVPEDEIRKGFKSQSGFEIAPTIDEVIRECDGAWERARELRQSYGKNIDEEIEKGIYVELVREHPDLNKTYPVILATMAGGAYHQKAVRKFFKYVQDHMWKTETEFLDVQSTYNTILYRITHPHVSQKAITAMREQTRDALAENEKKTKEEVEKARKIAEENNKRHARGRIADLLARVPRDAPIMVNGETRPVVVKFDDTQ